MDIVLNRRLTAVNRKKFEFVERGPQARPEKVQGLEEFLKNVTLSGDATEEELEFLKNLKFNGRKPTPLYYYRELQNLRDPLHFNA